MPLLNDRLRGAASGVASTVISMRMLSDSTNCPVTVPVCRPPARNVKASTMPAAPTRFSTPVNTTWLLIAPASTPAIFQS